MLKQIYRINILIAILSSNNYNFSQIKKNSTNQTTAANLALDKQYQVLKLVKYDYKKILQAYDLFKTAKAKENAFYFRELTEAITRGIISGSFHFYGNFFSRMWREWCLRDYYPEAYLLRFVDVYLFDAMGHLNKHCRFKGSYLDLEVELFMSKLTDLILAIKTSTEYKQELSIQVQHKTLSELKNLNNKIGDLNYDVSKIKSDKQEKKKKYE